MSINVFKKHPGNKITFSNRAVLCGELKVMGCYHRLWWYSLLIFGLSSDVLTDLQLKRICWTFSAWKDICSMMMILFWYRFSHALHCMLYKRTKTLLFDHLKNRLPSADLPYTCNPPTFVHYRPRRRMPGLQSPSGPDLSAWRPWAGSLLCSRKGIRPVKNRLVRCWCGCLSGAKVQITPRKLSDLHTIFYFRLSVSISICLFP